MLAQLSSVLRIDETTVPGSLVLTKHTSWDDWVPQDRLRKLTDDNRELAANLKAELTQQPPPRSAVKAATSKSRRGQGSDLGSGRGSEERHSSIPAGGRGTKRGKDNDIEKVGPIVPSNPDCYTNFPLDSLLNGRPYSSWTTEARGLLNSSEVNPESLPHGILRQTTQLPSVHPISDRETLPPYQEGTLLSNRRRRRNSPVPSAANGRSATFLTSYRPKRSTSAASMTLREAGQKAQRQLTQNSTRSLRKAQEILQHLSDESSEGEDDNGPLVRSPNRNLRRYANIINSNKTSTRDLTPAGANANATLEGKSYSSLTGFEIVRDFSPPPDEHEYISKDSEYNRQQFFFASLIGGTTFDEKHKIEDELAREGKRTDAPLVRHPKYDQTLREDRHNENKILFYYDQNPLQRLAIAGVSKDPIHLDPPGCASPYDALKFPNRLVEHLNRMDADTVVGWDEKSLKKIPTNMMSQLSPEVLACIPEVVLNRIPHLREKCSIDVLEGLKPKSGRLDDNFAKLAMLNLRDREVEIQDDHAGFECVPKTTLSSCLGCTSIGIKCSRSLPQCHACKKFGEECIYDGIESIEGYSTSKKESKYLGLDLSCPITQRHLHNAQINLLEPRTTKDYIPSKYRPKPTFTTQPNVPKIPMRNRLTKRICVAGVWQALDNLNPHYADFPGPALPTLAKFYPGALVETLTYPYSYPQEESFHLRPSIRITIPDHLKTLLVDDWENVTKSLLLVPLPSKAPANFIIDSYYDEEKANRRLGSADLDVLEEFCAGMKVYFEKSVGKILLYRFERGQLAEVSASISYHDCY